jgi:hypothetical protein
VRVGGVGLAGLPGREHPGTSRKLWWDVDDLLAFGEQPIGDVLADTRAALDCPDTARPLLALSHHDEVAVPVGALATTTENGLISGHDRDG